MKARKNKGEIMLQRFTTFLTCTCTQNQVVEQPNDFQNKIVLYNFLADKEAYKNKCAPLIHEMDRDRLLRDFSTLNKEGIDYFQLARNLDDDAFTERDLQHVLYFRPLLWSILNTGYEYILLESEREMDMLAKIIMKKYLLGDSSAGRKIFVRVRVGDSQHIKVVSYNNRRTKTGDLNFTDVKGSIEQGESAQDAVLREMKEELGGDWPLSRYILTEETDRHSKYVLQISEAECAAHFAALDTSELDPEITHIVLETIV
jgi:hypothetical protein